MMANGWRITTFNGLLLAAYFVPVWTSALLKIVIFPLRGIYERANIGPAMFANDYFAFTTLGMVRFAWLLALAKFLVVTYFALFAVLSLGLSRRESGASDEPLAFALAVGGLVSGVSMILAAKVGETAAMQLHATETLMLVSGLVLLVVDSRSYGVPRRVPAQQPA